MNLEYEVKSTVEAWDVSLVGTDSKDLSYSDLAKPLLYGIATGVVNKLVHEIYGRSGTQPPQQFLDLGYHDASTKFRKEYLIRNLKKHDFSGVETGVAIGLGNSRENARASLAQILKREFGTTVKNLKDQVGEYEYTESVEIGDAELEEMAVREIERYSSLFRPSVFRSLLTNKSRIMAEPLVSIAKRYSQEYSHSELFDMPYHDAIAEFKKWYLVQQIRRNGSGKNASQKSALSEEAFRQAICARNIKVAEVLSDDFESS